MLFDRIHPRYKRPISQRLWAGALQVAYNDSETAGRFQGPFPSNFVLAGNRRMEIDYDEFLVELEFRDLSIDPFEVGVSLPMRRQLPPEDPAWRVLIQHGRQ